MLFIDTNYEASVFFFVFFLFLFVMLLSFKYLFIIYNDVIFVIILCVDGDFFIAYCKSKPQRLWLSWHAQGQHHVIFWYSLELNPGRGICIPHQVPFHHRPTNYCAIKDLKDLMRDECDGKLVSFFFLGR